MRSYHKNILPLCKMASIKKILLVRLDLETILLVRLDLETIYNLSKMATITINSQNLFGLRWQWLQIKQWVHDIYL
jgi:hypothetical protein